MLIKSPGPKTGAASREAALFRPWADPPEEDPPDSKRSAEDWIDIIKQRSTLTGLVEPLGVTVGYLSQPLTNLKTVAEVGSALFSGDLGAVGAGVETLVDRAYNPHGLGGIIYNSALGIKTATGTLVGGLEVYAGLDTGNKYLVAMGVADLVGASASGCRLFDLDGVALGLSVASNLARTTMVLVKPEQYSRTQKVKTFLDAGGSIASNAMQSGFLVLPALLMTSVTGVGQIAYMNHEGFRNKVDGWLDKIFKPDKDGDS